MWFNIIKLDLSQLSTQIQGDADTKEINIPEENNCEKKIKRFEDNLYREFADDNWSNRYSDQSEILEYINYTNLYLMIYKKKIVFLL